MSPCLLLRTEFSTESIRPGTERDALGAVIRMIRHLGPRDRVSYLTMPNGALEVEFTERHDQVIDALWPHLDAIAGAANLRKAAHHARHTLAVEEEFSRVAAIQTSDDIHERRLP